MTVQALVLLVYGLPMLLAPKWWTALTQQPPLPENYILRAVGITFVILAIVRIFSRSGRRTCSAVVEGLCCRTSGT